MPAKPVNAFEQEKEQREKALRKKYAAQREAMVKRRTGLTRKNHTLRIQGAVMQVVSRELIRERWLHTERKDFSRGGKKGRSYHFAIWRYTLQSADGRIWTALQAQAHDSNHGHMLNVTGFWNVSPA